MCCIAVSMHAQTGTLDRGYRISSARKFKILARFSPRAIKHGIGRTDACGSGRIAIAHDRNQRRQRIAGMRTRHCRIAATLTW